ncbi:maleylpyruvate isomerase family mycothiol-dependent enzyme [Nocardia jiangxiensis]|uniref:maleylpyruvate isomerase family mycothiol-dependent enzyme n=1 Tax=Nocardia jiangxiensis TaxID=282685 RepID=UPI000A05279A|nr:maleylpyruvate isomerase family mycothiol-dependent enzyme [Nocardia jiangxiensis]
MPTPRCPSCPGWTARDLLGHVGQVYEHKTLCMTLGHAPLDEQRSSPARQETELSAWFVEQRDALLEQLTERGPVQQTFTWFPPDRTVGFWYRRMALETAVHRVDAELATGTRTPVDPELAVDGVDELVGFLVHDFGDTPTRAAGAGRTVQLSCGQRRWLLTLRADGVDYAAEGTSVDASTWGDPTALTALASRLEDETQ